MREGEESHTSALKIVRAGTVRALEHLALYEDPGQWSTLAHYSKHGEEGICRFHCFDI